MTDSKAKLREKKEQSGTVYNVQVKVVSDGETRSFTTEVNEKTESHKFIKVHEIKSK